MKSAPAPLLSDTESLAANNGNFSAALVQASPDCVKAISLDGRLEFMNENGLCVMEIDDFAAVCGAMWSTLWPEAERPKVEAALAAARTGGLGRFQGFCPTGKGAPKWWDVLVSPVRGPAGVERLLSVSRDITELKAVEARLRDALAAADAATRAKDDFIANLSHELRTPLTSILGFTELVARSPRLTAEEREHLAVVGSSGRSLLALLNDLIDIARAEAGTLTVATGPCDLAALAEAVAALAQPLAASKALRVGLTLEIDRGAFYELDQHRVHQVLLNLATNAVKFTDAGKVDIRVGLRQPPGGDELLFEVRDTGQGVAAAALPMLFERFVQADSSPSRRRGGAGLGLAICKELVGLMGGRIGADSTVGEGSCFWFALPALRVEPPAHVAPPEAPTRRLRILAADDNLHNQRLLASILDSVGHAVTIAGDGAEAVAFAQDATFDLILMDVQMPVMDGLAAMRALRRPGQRNAATPILAITANVLPAQIESYREAGAAGTLAKPFEVRAILDAIARHGGGEDPALG